MTPFDSPSPPNRSSAAAPCLTHLLGSSATFRATLARAERAAGSREPLLLEGRTGTGKSKLARWVHERSPRSEKPFVEIPCSSLPESLLEAELFGFVRGAFTGAIQSQAGKLACGNGGTVFLDEIAELSLAAQTKLLHFLQEGYFYRIGSHRPEIVDVRIIAATHQDLPQLVREGRFREDLYFRLAVLRCRLPCLAERGSDVTLLADSILQQIAKDVGHCPALSARARLQLESHTWPGNVRELQNVLKRAVFELPNGQSEIDSLEIDHPPEERLGGDPKLILARKHCSDERDRLCHAILQNEGSVSRAAQALGLSRFAFYRKLQKHGLSKHHAFAHAAANGHSSNLTDLGVSV